MGKMKKILAGIGVATVLGGCMVGATGCADMTDSQIQSALDTAIEANETFKDMVEALEKQNTDNQAQIDELQELIAKQNEDYNTQNSRYQELLAEKNALIEKIINQKEKEITKEEAHKLVYLAGMNYELETSVVDNIIMNVKISSRNTTANNMDYVVKIVRNEDGTLTIQHTDTLKDGSVVTKSYYGDDSGYIILTQEGEDVQKGTQAYDLNKLMKQYYGLSYMSEITLEEIMQVAVQEDNTIKVVAMREEISGYSKRYALHTFIFNQDGIIQSFAADTVSIDMENNQVEIDAHGIINLQYDKITKEEADEITNFVKNYSESVE